MLIASLVNNHDVLNACLRQSPDIRTSRTPLIVVENPARAACLNAVLQDTSSIVACVHQDVYLPTGWLDKVNQSIQELDNVHPHWGVLGVWGITNTGSFVGRTWCNGGQREHIGQRVSLPSEVSSIDEIVIILNPKANLRFDDQLPGFHLYATDICLQAAEKGYKNFVIDAPVVHNSKTSPVLDPTYYDSYRYMQVKWHHRLPVLTCVMPITRWGMPTWRRRAQDWKRKWFNPREIRPRHPAPSQLARELGYE